jgi:hypothetical protein
MERAFNDERKHNVAMRMLRRGLATMAEVAELRGVTRQYMHKAVLETNLEPQRARERHLKKVWKKMLES